MYLLANVSKKVSEADVIKEIGGSGNNFPPFFVFIIDQFPRQAQVQIPVSLQTGDSNRRG